MTWKKAWSFIWKKSLNPLRQCILCAKFCGKWPNGSVEENEYVKCLYRRTDDRQCEQTRGLRALTVTWVLHWLLVTRDHIQPNLAQSILGWRGFKFVQTKGPAFFQGKIITKYWKYIDEILKNLLLQNHWTNFDKLGTMHAWLKGSKVCSNERPNPFPKGDNYEIAKIHLRNLKIFFSRTTGQISTKLGTMHSWIKGSQDFSNEGPYPFPRGDNYEITKYINKI